MPETPKNPELRNLTKYEIEVILEKIYSSNKRAKAKAGLEKMKVNPQA